MQYISNTLNTITEFTRARLTLTLWYIAISMFLMVCFNYAALNAQSRAFVAPKSLFFEVPAQSDLLPAGADVIFLRQRGDEAGNVQTISIEEIRRNFQIRLLTFEVILLFLIALASYFLSGLTLSPIAQAMKEQEEFAADASHELRTPLSVISMEIESIKCTEKNIPVHYKLAFSHIACEVTRMTNIVSGLLTLVRSEQEKLPSFQEKVNLSDLIQKVQEQMEKLFNEKGYILKIQNEKNVYMYAIKDQIKQVIIILLDNALKYAKKEHTHVSVTVKRNNSSAFISVTDNGLGITPKHLRHIFERFYKVERESDGAGLGLAIAKQIIENHNGTIEIQSSEGKGTKVVIILPLYS